MTTPFMIDELNNSPRSRSSSIRRVRRTKDNMGSAPNSRPSSRPSSRPVSPTGSNYINIEPNNNSDDQIIPTAIVIKNIPFSVKKDALLQKLASLDVPAAYAFNYHFDNGVFRGLAFANYRTAEETEIVVNTINGLEIGGRKLRVEYKRVLPNSNSSINLAEYGGNDNNIIMNHSNSSSLINNNMIRKKERESIIIPSSSSSSQPGSPRTTERRLPNNPDEDSLDLNDPNVLELYSFLLLFRGDPNNTEIALPKTLSAKERRDAHLIADRLGLAHYSEGFGSERQVVIEKRGSIPAPIVRLQHKNSRGTLRSSPSRDRLNNMTNSNNGGNNSSNDNTKRDSYRKSMMSTSTTAEMNNTTTSSGIIHPIRQPRGPEPGKNFASRKVLMDERDQLADTLSRQQLTHVGA